MSHSYITREKMQTYAICTIRTLYEGEAHSLETNPSSSQRGCYIRTITARVQLGNKKKKCGHDPQGA
jgi:hypothetical protein